MPAQPRDAPAAEHVVDVIVVGGGIAGLTAGIRSAMAGAVTLLLESRTELGGSAPATADVLAAETSAQREVGLEDSAEAMAYDALWLSRYMVDERLIRTLSEGSSRAIEWLRGLGLELSRRADGSIDLFQSGVEQVARGHRFVGGGSRIVKALLAEAEARGLDVWTDVQVSELLVIDGQVSGVLTQRGPVYAPSIVLATGGFENDRLLLEEFYPEAAALGDDLVVPQAGGDGSGIRLGRAVGAQTVGRDFGTLEVQAPDFRFEAPGPDLSQTIWVDRRGARFADETLGVRAVLPGIVDAAGDMAWAILDGESLARFADAEAKMLERVGIRSESVADLAGAAGMRPRLLAATLARVNEDIRSGVDSCYGRDFSALSPVAKPPFIAIPMRPRALSGTGIGLQIDTNARVCSNDGDVIAGLFACGELVGGLRGACALGYGAEMTEALVFGRIAGAAAADYSYRTSSAVSWDLHLPAGAPTVPAVEFR